MQLKVGDVIRPPMFVATSLHRTQAMKFRENAMFLIRIHIQAYCVNACCIQDHSEYGHEQEVLIPPYSPFEIKHIDSGAREIHAVLLDGSDYEVQERASGVYARAVPI